MYIGGDYIYVIIFIIFSILISYNLISYIYIIKKSKYIFLSKIKIKSNQTPYILKKYIYIINQKLDEQGNPYGLNAKKYIIIKYFLSSFLFLIIFLRSYNIIISVIFFIVFFYLPNFLIVSYKKTEQAKIINEISNIVQNVILSLSAKMSLYEALKISLNTVTYVRFKTEYEKFIQSYMIYNFNLVKAIPDFKKKFDFYEFNMFTSVLIQGQKEGNILESLEAFDNSLKIIYIKYLKLKSTKRILVISFATIISLINSFVIVLYPIAIQISDNLTEIFK